MARPGSSTHPSPRADADRHRPGSRPCRRARGRAAVHLGRPARLDATALGSRLRLPRRGRRAHPRSRLPGPHPGPGDPARLDRRVDLSRPDRPPPGQRTRCGRTQAVPLPRRLARPSRRGQVRPDARVRFGAAPDPTPRRARSGPSRAAPREGPGRGGPPPRADAHPGRERRIRPAKSLIRADHAPRPPCSRGRHQHPVPIPRQVGPAARSGPARPATRRRRSPLPGAARARSCSSTRTRTGPSTTSPRTTSTPTFARSPAATSPPRISGPGRGRSSPIARCEPSSPMTTRRRPSGWSSRRCARRPVGSGIRRPWRDAATSIRRSSRRTSTGRSRVRSSRSPRQQVTPPGGATAAEEAAVVRLLRQRQRQERARSRKPTTTRRRRAS